MCARTLSTLYPYPASCARHTRTYSCGEGTPTPTNALAKSVCKTHETARFLSRFNYDLAMCVYFPYMLSRAGRFLDGSEVPGREAAEQFRAWVCDG